MSQGGLRRGNAGIRAARDAVLRRDVARVPGRVVRQEPVGPRDLRLGLAAVSAWVAAAVSTNSQPGTVLLAALLLAGAALAVACVPVPRRDARQDHHRRVHRIVVPVLRGSAVPAAAACLICLAAAGSLIRFAAGPVAEAAARGESITAVLRIGGEPTIAAPDRFSGQDRVVVEATVRGGQYRGEAFVAAAPVTVLGNREWLETGPGDTVRVIGTLAPPSGPGKSVALFIPATPPELTPVRGWMAYTAGLRNRFTAAAGARGADDGGLLPGMAIGDRTGLDESLAEAMKTTGLTHLTAVSGANCSYVLAFVFLVARSARLPRPWAAAAALAALAGFVLLVRPEPSVLRAAVMGSIGVLAVLSGRGRLSLSLLFLSIITLLAADPWLHSSYAFILSVSATAGLVVAGPYLAARLSSILPSFAAQLLAVPITAQLFCTPVLVLLQPTLPLYSVPANVAAAPLVPVITVAGMLAIGALVLLPPAAVPFLIVGQVGTTWVAAVARLLQNAPHASVPWLGGPAGAVLTGVLCLAVVLAFVFGPALVRAGRRAMPSIRPPPWVILLGGGCGIGLVLVMILLPEGDDRTGGWVLAACDVGQGDSFVLQTGKGRAVVIDAGPDPGAVDSCLSALSVDVVEVLVLTHLHNDHYAGIAGVADGRRIDAIFYSSAESELPRAVLDAAEAAGTEPVRIAAGHAFRAGGTEFSVLWPPRDAVPVDENDASAVLRADVGSPGHTLSILLTGDIEETASAAMLARNPELTEQGIDVLKVAHHGARNGGSAMIEALRPKVALISVGKGNDYGHPHPATISTLDTQGTVIARTDQLGSFTLAMNGSSLDIRGMR
ncbi:ComEC/Rec2 family competence protein [Arthrobacter sp. Br18]|uniref:ComEC/Rec2 family competence protein n=1 Tax=Arthrobacter sp. Br18 TaxID=1312954 RepID=UPI0012DE8329|nr:ComEC/Rec2 family competence protein [Arthrobacter sp. Br18]